MATQDTPDVPMLDRLLAASYLIPPSHVPKPEQLPQLVAALALQAQLGDAFLEAAEAEEDAPAKLLSAIDPLAEAQNRLSQPDAPQAAAPAGTPASAPSPAPAAPASAPADAAASQEADQNAQLAAQAAEIQSLRAQLAAAQPASVATSPVAADHPLEPVSDVQPPAASPESGQAPAPAPAPAPPPPSSNS